MSQKDNLNAVYHGKTTASVEKIKAASRKKKEEKLENQFLRFSLLFDLRGGAGARVPTHIWVVWFVVLRVHTRKNIFGNLGTVQLNQAADPLF